MVIRSSLKSNNGFFLLFFLYFFVTIFFKINKCEPVFNHIHVIDFTSVNTERVFLVGENEQIDWQEISSVFLMLHIEDRSAIKIHFKICPAWAFWCFPFIKVTDLLATIVVLKFLIVHFVRIFQVSEKVGFPIIRWSYDDEMPFLCLLFRR